MKSNIELINEEIEKINLNINSLEELFPNLKNKSRKPKNIAYIFLTIILYVTVILLTFKYVYG